MYRGLTFCERGGTFSRKVPSVSRCISLNQTTLEEYKTLSFTTTLYGSRGHADVPLMFISIRGDDYHLCCTMSVRIVFGSHDIHLYSPASYEGEDADETGA